MSERDDVLGELGRVLTTLGPALSPPGSEALLNRITEAAKELFGAQACSLALLTDDESELVFTTASGAGAETVVDLRIPANQGIAGWVVMSEQPMSVADLANDTRFATDVAESTGYVPQAILAVPVASPRRMLGVIEVLDRDADRPGAEHDMRLLQLFADQAALAIENARVFSDLGRAVLGAVAAAEPGGSLADALAAAGESAQREDEDLLEIATLFAQLERLGGRERRLAVDLLRVLVANLGGRGRRPS
jgi:GAF domain-containing protein